MIDELPSHWWATFKVNSGSPLRFTWLSSLRLSPCSIAYHFPSPTICLLVFHTHCHLSPQSSSPSSLQCQSIWLSCALSRSPSHSLPPLSLIFGPIQPSFFFSLESHGVFAQVALSALKLVCSPFLSLSVFSYSPSWCSSFRQLMENKISTIERGAFQDLKELERLWVTFCNWSRRYFILTPFLRENMLPCLLNKKMWVVC